MAASFFIELDKTTPQSVVEATVKIVDLDGERSYKFQNAIELSTPYKFAEISYSLKFANGQSLFFLPHGYIVRPDVRKIKIGGELKVSAATRNTSGVRIDSAGKKFNESQLAHYLTLTDKNKHLVDTHKSRDLLRLDYEIQLKKEKNYALIAEGSYWYGDHKKFSINTRHFDIFNSRNSLSFLPKEWSWVAALYLLRSQFTYEAWQKFLEAKSPERVHINWRFRCCLGLGSHKNKQITMPFTVFSPKNIHNMYQLDHIPWALVHEFGHGFGYKHGELMNKRIEEAKSELRQKLQQLRQNEAEFIAHPLIQKYAR